MKHLRRTPFVTKKRQELHPFPGIVSPPLDGEDGWEVQEGPPTTDTVRRKMQVPVVASELTRQLQLHELAHAKWTPEVDVHALAKQEKIPESLIQACEDARLSIKLAENNLPQNEALFRPVDRETIKHDPKFTHQKAAEFMAGTYCTGDYDGVTEVVRHRYGNNFFYTVAEMIHDEVSDDHADFDNTITLARKLSVFANAEDKKLEDEKRQIQPGDGDPNEVTNDEIIRSLKQIGESGIYGGNVLVDMSQLGKEQGDKVNWGTMEIKHFPLTVPMPRRMMKGRRRINTDTGAVPRGLHRTCIDGRVFAGRAKRLRGGAVLIDMSGSMSLSTQQVDAIIQAMPGVMMAGYSAGATKGTLRIIASNGKRVSNEQLQMISDMETWGGSNVIDGPALEWLGRQKGPRFWVSDGYVTEQNDNPTDRAIKYAALVCLKNRILRVNRADAVLKENRFGR